MIVSRRIRTKDLADAVGVSVQQVRNFEADGLIPEAERNASGYRIYTRQHVDAMKTARYLIRGYGRQNAEAIMQALHRGDTVDALARIDAHHAELDRLRLQLRQTLDTLERLTVQLPMVKGHSRAAKRVHVGEAARLVGVRVSALRHWEEQGLLHPIREAQSNYRLYDEKQLRRLRIVALLRQENYDFDTIHTTLDEVEAGQPARAIAAVEQRRSRLAAMSWHCLQALAMLHDYMRTYLGDAVETEMIFFDSDELYFT